VRTSEFQIARIESDPNRLPSFIGVGLAHAVTGPMWRHDVET